MMPVFDIINPNANISTFTTNLTNLTNNTFQKILQVFTNAFGSEIFFALIFTFLTIGAYIQSDRNKLVALSVVLMMTVICGVLLASIISIIFSIIIALLITDILYQSWVNR